MNVQQYLFQSPYTNSVQVGRPDPSSKPEETTSNETSSAQVDTNVTKQQPEHPTQVESANTVSSVTPNVSSNQLLDVYA